MSGGFCEELQAVDFGLIFITSRGGGTDIRAGKPATCIVGFPGPFAAGVTIVCVRPGSVDRWLVDWSFVSDLQSPVCRGASLSS